MADIKESDWKIFKKIKKNAIDRYCNRCLNEYAEIIADKTEGNHNKYLYHYRVVQNRDKKMSLIFGDNTSRSKAFIQLLAIRKEGLAEETEIAQLTAAFQESTDPKRLS